MPNIAIRTCTQCTGQLVAGISFPLTRVIVSAMSTSQTSKLVDLMWPALTGRIPRSDPTGVFANVLLRQIKHVKLAAAGMVPDYIHPIVRPEPRLCTSQASSLPASSFAP